MDDMYELLASFNFTKIEADLYIHLLQYPQLNGSQLAKIVSLPRSTVYNSLGNLQKRGAVILLPGIVNVYQAEEPGTLFGRVKDELARSADRIREELSKISIKKPSAGFANIEGYFNVLSKAKEFLSSSRREIYMHTNMRLSSFREELIESHDRGIRVIVFSFQQINDENLPVELYYSDKFSDSGYLYSKILLVVDQERALIARGYAETDYRGMYSADAILVDLVSEHIHHDIYLHKLEKKHGLRNIVGKDILVNSLQEKKIKKRLS